MGKDIARKAGTELGGFGVCCAELVEEAGKRGRKGWNEGEGVLVSEYCWACFFAMRCCMAVSWSCC